MGDGIDERVVLLVASNFTHQKHRVEDDARDDERARVGKPVEPVDRLLDPEVHAGAQGVARFRAVDRAVGEVAVSLEAQERGSQVDDLSQGVASSRVRPRRSRRGGHSWWP